MDPVYLPINEYLDINDWPFGGVLANSLKDVYLEPPVYDESSGDTIIGLILPFDFSFKIPGLDFLTLGIGGVSGNVANIRIKLYPLKIILQANLTLAIDKDILCPLKLGTKEPDLDKPSFDIPLGVIDLEINSQGEINLQIKGTPSIPPCMIGNTGVILQIGKILWISQSTPEAELPSPPTVVPSGFLGLFLDDVIVDISQLSTGPSKIYMNSVFIGTGGFSGKISFSDNTLTWNTTNHLQSEYTGELVGKLFGFQAGISNAEIEFKHNCLIKNLLKGEIFLPFFDKRIGIELRLDYLGKFTALLSAPFAKELPLPDADNPTPELTSKGVLYLKKTGIVEAYLNSLSLESNTDQSYIQLNGKIRPLVSNLDWPEFDFKTLKIDSKGRIDIDGGWMNLPEVKRLNFYGFILEISKIGFGTINDTGEQWISFSGSINLPLPAGASVEGLRIIWDPKQLGFSNYFPKIELNGVGVKMSIPNVFSFEGEVDFFEDENDGSKGFRGNVKLKLEPLKFTVEGQLIIGKNREGYTFFYIYLSTNLSTGIPLFNTGVSIYGFQGIFGSNMEPNRKIEETWYEGWYKRSPMGATDISKWGNVQGSLALGLGVTLGTSTDDGFSINTKTLLILVMPGPIILLEGKGNILKIRPETKQVTAEGAFTALLALDGRQRIFQINLDARYNLVKVINIHGGAEAFFDFDRPGDWHLFLGQKEPEDKRIQATLLDLFTANAYWMMWKNRLETGTWIGYKGGPWEYGPLSARIEAWMSGYGLISRNPSHLEAAIQLFGLLELHAFGAGIDICVDAKVEGRGPTPWEFDALLKGALKINLLFTTIDLHTEIHLHYEEDLDAYPVKPISAITAEHLKTDESWEIPFVESVTNRDSSTALIDLPSISFPFVPPDAHPIVSFNRPIFDNISIGQSTLVKPEPDIIKAGRFEFGYQFNQIELLKKSKSSTSEWIPISAAVNIKEYNETGQLVILSHPIENGTLFKGGKLLFASENSTHEYEIVEASDNEISLKIPSSSIPKPTNGPCLLAANSPIVTGQIINQSSIKNNLDGSSTVTISFDLPGDINAFGGGTLFIENKRFKVIGNSKREIYILNNFENGEVVPSLGDFTLEAPLASILYGQWLPTDQTDPTNTIKLELWSKTPYTYFRRNDSSTIPPISYDICGPDVKEEPLCVGFQSIHDLTGSLVNYIKPNNDYKIDGITFNVSDKVILYQNLLTDPDSLRLDSEKGDRAVVTFYFKGPVDMVKVDGSNELEAFAYFTGGSFEHKIFAQGSVQFDAAKIVGQIESLKVLATYEKIGVITGICFLPGWTCVNIPKDKVPADGTKIHIASIEISGRNDLILSLEAIGKWASDLSQILPETIKFVQVKYPQYLSTLRLVYNLASTLQKSVLDILTSLQVYTIEELRQLHQSIQSIIQNLKQTRATIPVENLPAVVLQVVDLSDNILSHNISLDNQSNPTIRLPKPVTRLRMILRGRVGTKLNIKGYGGTTEFVSTSVTAQTVGVLSILEVVSVEDGWIDNVKIDGFDPAIEEICYDRSEFALARKEQYISRQKWQQQLQYWYKVDEVMEPNTDYCIRAITTVTNMGIFYNIQYWHGFFHTGLPPMGTTVESQNSYPNGGVLSDLNSYIFRTIPTNGAGAEGKLPVYRGYDVAVEFNENYVDRLYNLTKMPLEIHILDNNGVVVTKISNYSAERPEQIYSEGERKWVSVINQNGSKRCAKIDWSEVPGDSAIYARGEHMTLSPRTLHKAELVAKEDTNNFHKINSFEFTTSKFVNFIHHIHSFREKVWEVQSNQNSSIELDNLFNQSLNAVLLKKQSVNEKSIILSNLDTKIKGSLPSESDFIAYDKTLKELEEAWIDLELESNNWFKQITEKLGLSDNYNSIQDYEITLIKNGDNESRHPILLQSPEPIDWRRTNISELICSSSPILASTNDTTLQSLEHGSNLKISNVHLPVSSDPNNYWIELIALKETILDDYKIEVAEDNLGELHFKEYITFPKGMVLEEGRRISSVQGENQTGVKSIVGTRISLTPKITWIRLLKNNGSDIVNQLIVQPDVNYSDEIISKTGTKGSSEILLLSNLDGTSALILLRSQTTGILEIPVGVYKLTFDFYRNIGSQSPILSEAGDTTPESVTIQFIVQ